MPGRRLRQPYRNWNDMWNPLAMLAAAFVLLWAVILYPAWERAGGAGEPSLSKPTLASRAIKPT
jgi:hypothetical protein